MLTTADPPVNAAPIAAAVMVRIADIAHRDGISSAAVSKAVKQLVDKHGLQVEKDHRGRVTSVNLAHYDELRSKFGDPSKAQAPKEADQDGGRYDRALADKTAYEAERARLRLAAEIGGLVPRDDVEQAMDDAGLRIARTIDQLAGATDELAAAYEQGGIQQLRIKLRDLVRDARETVADVLEAAAAEAPETAHA